MSQNSRRQKKEHYKVRISPVFMEFVLFNIFGLF